MAPVFRNSHSHRRGDQRTGRRSHPAPERRLGLVEAIGHAAARAGVGCYSMISSARSIIDGGIARPSAVAVLRFTTISNLVGS